MSRDQRRRSFESSCEGEFGSTARIFQTVTIGLALLFAVWGTWLLLGDDPDGGAHAGGWFMLIVAAVLALLAAFLLRPNEAQNGRADRSSRAIWGAAAAVAVGVLVLLLFGTP